MSNGFPRDLAPQLRRITIGGSLAMVYMACVGSPVTTDFFRSLGATGFQFGLLGGVPMVMLFMQFLGGYLAGHVQRRKPWFMVLAITSRLLYIPIALLPLMFPRTAHQIWTPLFIVLLSVSGALAHLITPLWFSWMGDVIPRRILSLYWGTRQRYMHLVWTLALLGVAAFSFYLPALPVLWAFLTLVVVGLVAGVVDILLFRGVHEPPNPQTEGRGAVSLFLEPFRHKEYRTIVLFTSMFAAATMFGAAFMQLYVLDVLGMDLWKTNLMWATVGFGTAMVSRTWGRIIDRHGPRPVLRLCVFFKPLVALAFVLVTPRVAFPVLGVVFYFDAMLNSGYNISLNGFMLKSAPRENRSMFVAAVTAVSGIAGGLSAIASGWLLHRLEGFSPVWLGRTWNNYHVIFLISFLLRIACIPLTARVRERDSSPTVTVFNYLMGLWPMRVILFPVGLYRRATAGEDEPGAPEEESTARRSGEGP